MPSVLVDITQCWQLENFSKINGDSPRVNAISFKQAAMPAEIP
jgi:hypothetical protein